MSVRIFPPSTEKHDDFEFRLHEFMGKWYVTHSTLRLWKNKKDVSITYTPLSDAGTPQQGPVRFDDLVEYYSSSATPGSKPSTIAGTDHTLAVGSFKWRGNGLLVIVSSKWQVLGCNTSDAEGSHPWAVTFFEKTLFTPAGLDIYARSAEGLPEPLLEEIFEKIKAVGGDVATLSEAFFEVERTK